MSRSSVRQGQWKDEGAGGRPPSPLTGSACLATESSYRRCLGCWLWLSFEWGGVVCMTFWVAKVDWAVIRSGCSGKLKQETA